MEQAFLEILSIDGDASNISFLKNLSEKNDESDLRLKIINVKTLSEGLDLIPKKNFKLILLNLTLPNSKGIETLYCLQNKISGIPIIICSKSTNCKLTKEAIEKGADDYIVPEKTDRHVFDKAIYYAIGYKQIEKEIAKVNQLKSEFVATVSHELRTPITIVKESISQVIDGIVGDVTDEQKEYLMMAVNGIERLRDIINDLLDISHIEARRLTLHKNVIDITELVREAMLDFSDEIKSKKIKIKENLPVTKVYLHADRNKIKQILNNLLVNAIKFTDSGVIQVDVVDENRHIKISISDTGAGISEEDKDKVFGKFQQFNRIPGPGERGTGLGLSICRGLVEAHRGKIWFKSELEKGTKFSFILPKYTSKEFLREQLTVNLKKAITKRTSLSLGSFKVVDFDQAAKKLGATKILKVLRELEAIVKGSLRREADIAFEDKTGVWVILSETNTQNASGVMGRICEILNNYLSSQKWLDSKMRMIYAVSGFPENGETTEMLLNVIENKLKDS